jgi:transposase-like protein
MAELPPTLKPGHLVIKRSTTMDMKRAGVATIAGDAEVNHAIATLVLAFATDPVARWMYDDPHQYLLHIPRLLVSKLCTGTMGMVRPYCNTAFANAIESTARHTYGRRTRSILPFTSGTALRSPARSKWARRLPLLPCCAVRAEDRARESGPSSRPNGRAKQNSLISSTVRQLASIPLMGSGRFLFSRLLTGLQYKPKRSLGQSGSVTRRAISAWIVARDVPRMPPGGTTGLIVTDCVGCGSGAVTERPDLTAQGYRRFRCRACGKQFNERSDGVLNRASLPSDIIAFVVFCRLRYRLTLRDLSEILLLRGFTMSHECIRQWEAKLLPLMGEVLRRRRQGTRRRSGRSWYVDETYLRVPGRWCYLYRAIDRDGNLIDTMLSAPGDIRAAEKFFRSARSVAGFVPDPVTTDGHNSYPRAIRSTLGRNVCHRTSVYLNNRLEQDHRGIKGRLRCMRGFKAYDAADRFC